MRSLESFENFMPTTTTNSKQMTQTDIEFKSKLFAKDLTETIYNIANEPSIGFYRIEVNI
jgi:hypothetical protein